MLNKGCLRFNLAGPFVTPFIINERASYYVHLVAEVLISICT